MSKDYKGLEMKRNVASLTTIFLVFFLFSNSIGCLILPGAFVGEKRTDFKNKLTPALQSQSFKKGTDFRRLMQRDLFSNGLNIDQARMGRIGLD